MYEGDLNDNNMYTVMLTLMIIINDITSPWGSTMRNHIVRSYP